MTPGRVRRRNLNGLRGDKACRVRRSETALTWRASAPEEAVLEIPEFEGIVGEEQTILHEFY